MRKSKDQLRQDAAIALLVSNDECNYEQIWKRATKLADAEPEPEEACTHDFREVSGSDMVACINCWLQQPVWIRKPHLYKPPEET